MAGHTPGPWKVDYSDNSRLSIISAGYENDIPLAFCNLQDEDGDQDEANAWLIASAPMMAHALAGCEALLSQLQDNPDKAVNIISQGYFGVTLIQVRAILAQHKVPR